MKTEAEIRRHLANLKMAMNLPCDCKENGHADECERGLEMMTAVTENLSWVLGENENLNGHVKRLNDDMKRRRASMN